MDTPARRVTTSRTRIRKLRSARSRAWPNGQCAQRNFIVSPKAIWAGTITKGACGTVSIGIRCLFFLPTASSYSFDLDKAGENEQRSAEPRWITREHGE